MPADRSRFGPETWIGIDDSARYLSVPVRTMYRLAQRGQLPAVKVGRTWRFKRSALDEHLRTLHAAIGMPSRPTAPEEAPYGPEARRWSQQLERIEALSRRLSRSRDVASVADAVASEIASVIDWHGLRFFVVGARRPDAARDRAAQHRAALHPRDGQKLLQVQIGQGLAGHVAASRVAEIVPDVRNDPRGFKIPGTDDVDESMIVVPLVYEDAIVGVLELIRLGTRRLRCDRPAAGPDRRRAGGGGALQRAPERGAGAPRRGPRAATGQPAPAAGHHRATAADQRPQSVFEAIADTLAEVVPHDTLTIYSSIAPPATWCPILARDPYAEQILADRMEIGTGITGDVIAKGEAELINDAVHDPRVDARAGTPEDQQESLIVAPVRGPDGVIGSLNLYREERHFDEEDLELVKLFANHVAIALENAAMKERLIEAALTDPLTGLPNRRLFADRIDHALSRRERSSRRLAVLFLDLDRFKLVNDGLGHAAGDAVLHAIGQAAARRACGRATPWPASVATSSASSSRTCTTLRRRPRRAQRALMALSAPLPSTAGGVGAGQHRIWRWIRPTAT